MAGTLLRLTVAVALTSALLLGCSPPEDSPPAEESPAAGSVTSPDTTASMAEGPALSDALKRDCRRDPASAGPGRGGLNTGQTAVDFTLKDVNGREFSLSALLAEKPVVMVFGSFT